MIHRWKYFFSDLTLNKLKNDLTEASLKGEAPPTKKLLTLGESLQYVSLNSYLDFVFYFSKNKELTVNVDVLRNTHLDPKKFEQMI